MSYFGKSFKHVFCFCRCLPGLAFLGACGDIPDLPDSSAKIHDFEVYVHQSGKDTYEPLKINSNDSASLAIYISPENERERVRCFWYNGEDLLDSGMTYPVSTTMTASTFTARNFIPDRVEIADREGNRLGKNISVIINAPPQIVGAATPANGDTLYGNSHTPFLFAWYSWDSDNNDRISNTIEIDGISYSLGEMNQIMQSGFGPGEHYFRVIVEDSRGDRDSIAPQTFIVIDPVEGK